MFDSEKKFNMKFHYLGSNFYKNAYTYRSKQIITADAHASITRKNLLIGDKEIIEFAKKYIKSQLNKNELLLCSYDTYSKPYNEVEHSFDCDSLCNPLCTTLGISFSKSNLLKQFLLAELEKNEEYDDTSAISLAYNVQSNLFRQYGKMYERVYYFDNLVESIFLYSLNNKYNKSIHISYKELVRRLIDDCIGHERRHSFISNLPINKQFDIFKRLLHLPYTQSILNKVYPEDVKKYTGAKTLLAVDMWDSTISSRFIRLLKELDACRAGLIYMVKMLHKRYNKK